VRVDTVRQLGAPGPLKTHISETGPITITMGIGNDCGGYWDGDIYRCSNDDCTNHSIVVVGYDEEGDYWIAKNSWGTGFGDEGYFKLGYGECGFTNARGVIIDRDWADVTAGPLGDPGAGTGTAWCDYDGDGDFDLYLANADGPDRLLSNGGRTGFVDVTAPPLGHPGASAGVAWADYDNDGDWDLYVGDSAGPNKLYRNDGATFTDVSSPPIDDASETAGVSWADYDADGLVDLYVVNAGANRLFRNLGGGAFVDATAPPLDDAGDGLGAAWADYDDDGDLDLYVANHTSGNRLFANLTGGAFEDVTTPPLDDAGRSTGVAWGDYDNDDDLDLYVANADGPNRLFRNDGGSVFTDVASGALAHAGDSRGVVWEDVDLDGRLDLLVGNSGAPNLVFVNLGWGHFLLDDDRAVRDEGDARGLACADYDGDGDPDLYVSNSSGENSLFANDAARGHHWLHIALEGVTSNRAGIGARVRLAGYGWSQIREVSGGSGYLSQSAPVAVFGLGERTVVDAIEVRWPSGLRNMLYGVESDRTITIVEDAAPSAPSGLLATPDEGSVDLRWNAVADTDFVRYEVERDTTSAFGAGAFTIASADTACLDAPLVEDEYFYRVFSVDTAGNRSAAADTVSCVPYQNPPPVPGALSAVPTESTVALSWGPSGVPDLDHYRIERDTTDAFGPLTEAFTAGDTSYIDAPVPNEVEHFYRIVAVDYEGFESPPGDTVSCVCPNYEPSPPQGLEAGSGEGVVTLDWSANPELDLAGYVVYRDTLPGMETAGAIGYATDPEFVDDTCSGPTEVYWYSVRAEDLLGLLGEPSDTVSGAGVLGEGVYVDYTNTGYQNGTHSYPFNEIQEAIDASAPGDGVLVYPGIYDGALTLRDSIMVLGMLGASQTIIGGTVVATGLSEATAITGFTVDGSGFGAPGIDCVASDLQVKGCRFEHSSAGISCRGGGSAKVVSSVFASNQTGVACADSSAPHLRGNTFVGNAFADVTSSGDPGPLVGGQLAAANDFLGGSFFMIFNNGPAEIAAEYNYWAGVCPDSSWFLGPVDMTPWTDESHTEVYTGCPTGVTDEHIPLVHAMGHNFPNPFNPVTHIAYDVPSPGGDVRLAIFAPSGRLVRMLIDRKVLPGRHLAAWDGTDSAGRPVSSGVYFCRLEADGFQEERKMVLLR
jgi:fibronectin type 3 domain-containing protein